jgi:preprotein translocase subunit SecF
MFITAMLTIVGFAINNTCVVYDRIRENVRKGISKDFAVTVNSSILETIARCINTSLTVILTCLALYIFGGVTIQQFIMALLVGVLVGIYDSIFVAGAAYSLGQGHENLPQGCLINAKGLCWIIRGNYG